MVSAQLADRVLDFNRVVLLESIVIIRFGRTELGSYIQKTERYSGSGLRRSRYPFHPNSGPPGGGVPPGVSETPPPPGPWSGPTRVPAGIITLVGGDPPREHPLY